MRQRQQTQELSEEDRQVVADMIRRMSDGAKLAEVFGLDNETMTGLEAQAYRLYRHGRFSQAQVAGRGVLALDADRTLTRFIMGDMALAEYRFAEAVEHLGHAFERSPEQLVIRARLGEALLKRGDRKSARPHLEAVVEGGDEGDDNVRRCRALLSAIDP